MVVLIIKIVDTALQMLSKQLKNYKQINRIKKLHTLLPKY